MDKHFTHLHLHTDHSLLDGAITLDKLVNFGKKNNFKALAITDHGNIFGAVKFFQQAQKAGIKPILGMEAYFTENAALRDADNKYYHLILLVQNAVGYKNLCKLISFAYQQGFYFKPRIDYAILEQYSEGLIVTSACLGGHIPSLLMQNNYEEADKRIDWFLRVFGKERFYLEVQPEDQEDQKILNKKIFEIAKRKDVHVVATGDCHYVTPEDREAHEVMLAIQTHHKVTDPGRFTFGDCRVHMRTQNEMLEIFKDNPEAIWNTGKIADMCNFTFETGKLFFPQFEIPDTYTQESYFEELCKTGLQKLFDTGRIDINQPELYWDRLSVEIKLIVSMGFIGYFLVVSDFIGWARTNGIPVGPGRGSAAGSLVAWALQITDIDPLKYNLLFERFLNPERISMPDIDIDFCIEGRDAVIEYVRTKYGHDKVCQIITFGTMMAKGVIKDVARALGFPFEDSNALTDLIPDQLKITLTEALEQEPKLKELIAGSPNVAKLFDLALRLEGITRHASKHAAGIVISPEPISDVLPVYIPSKSTDLVTQYAMTELESLGYLKMDFLGLKNLTLIDRAIKLIQQNHALTIDITKLPLDDAKTFALLCRGETSGVFQLESDGLKDVLRRLQPACFEDIIAVNALYRPGPLGSGMVDDFIECKHGRQPIKYIFPELEPLLKETYGVIVYQEQVIKIASSIANYSLGEADILRRAMGKKKADEMDRQKAIFVERAIKRNFDGKKSGELFDLMAYFAGYGFNKSHSAAYALIAYQTAYLKANFCAEFMACLISLEASDGDQMAFYVQAAKEIGLTILPPDVNQSQVNFSVVDGNIRFGLHGIKNVGKTALENIIKEREAKGSFRDLLDLCNRVDLRSCNKRVLESLIYSGALDQLPGNRSQKFEELAKVIDRALEKKKAARTGQLGLFDQRKAATQGQEDTEIFMYQARAEWSDAIKLEKEKEVVGLYVTAQPLDSYARQLAWAQTTHFAQASKLPIESAIICGGSLAASKVVTTKKGDKMAFLTLEDTTSRAEIVVFPKLYTQVGPWLDSYQVFLVKGTLDTTSTQTPKIKAQTCIPLDLLFEPWACEKLVVGLPENFEPALLSTLKSKLVTGSTGLEFHFVEKEKPLRLVAKDKIRLDAQALLELEKYNITLTILF
ncbi:DNA polymerase III subunit alpha [Candidatus Dependentiae bacterium]|nr:DNA polymerase III subunit alpha [Candidatus Dependentiae bacterium]